MRKLASVRRVAELLSIDGADRIELALIDGWQVVVQKGLYTPGSLAIYMEIDSFLNGDDPRFASFEERFITWEGKRGLRVKTIKLRKQLSQGLLMPLSEFPEIKNPEEGDDVTEVLKIVKWEPAEESSSNNGGSANSGKTKPFPSFIRKTDQERAQNLKNRLDKYIDETFEITIKRDGSSLTAYAVQPGSKFYDEAVAMKEGRRTGLQKFIAKIRSFFKKPQAISAVCSRNVQLGDSDTSNFTKMDKVYGLTRAIIYSGRSLAIQGEMIGPDIQGNYEKVDDHKFRCFNVFDIDAQEYLTPLYAQKFCDDLGIPYIEVHKTTTLRAIQEAYGLDLVNSLLAEAEGPGVNKGVKREGLVYNHLSSDFSFKTISNSYLLSKG